MEIVVVEPILILPRSSASHQALVVTTKKVGVFNTGEWEWKPKTLVETQDFDSQMLKRDAFYDIEDQFSENNSGRGFNAD
jgi:hypothetical protein